MSLFDILKELFDISKEFLDGMYSPFIDEELYGLLFAYRF
jgi:hypothetical protein